MVNPMDMTGRTVLVTGASSGIGRATAGLLSRLGARLVLVGRNAERLAETYGRLEGCGHRIEQMDLTGVDSIPKWLKTVANEIGPLDGLVHSAGVQKTRPLSVLDYATLESLMRINLGAAVALTRGFRQKGVCAQASSVVFISSVMGSVGAAGVAAYAASKGAVDAVTRALAVELAREGIRVNGVAPGHVRTEMSEGFSKLLTSEQRDSIEAMHLLGLGTPEDVACAVAFLLADTARWITGTVLVVDGGYTAH
jgi:NAD(P)-dependent dehydrogenase (short-subunit alcohol dehydrogenase family)